MNFLNECGRCHKQKAQYEFCIKPQLSRIHAVLLKTKTRSKYSHKVRYLKLCEDCLLPFDEELSMFFGHYDSMYLETR